MLYFSCQTCGIYLANREIPFEDGLKNICNNSKLSEQEKEAKKMSLIDELKITKYCCRMRILTYCDLVKIIK